MKKTSKKILSFFLAVVMAVSACSVGFTAWAQEVNPTDKLFNDTDLDAKTSIDEINKVLDTYLPDILTAIDGENNTLGNIGWATLGALLYPLYSRYYKFVNAVMALLLLWCAWKIISV